MSSKSAAVLFASIMMVLSVGISDAKQYTAAHFAPLESGEKVNFTLVMKMQNQAEMVVPNEFLGGDEFSGAVYPSESTVELIGRILEGGGLDVVSVEGIAMKVSGDAEDVNRFFNNTMGRLKSGNVTIFSPISRMHVPESISAYVMGIEGIGNSIRARPFYQTADAMDAYGNSPFTPSDLWKAYGYDQLLSRDINGNGTRIAIVDAYGYENIADDVSMFSSAYGLPNATLNIYYPDGKPILTCNDPPPMPGSELCGWAVETALDVEWVHAMAPYATIDLVISKDSEMQSLTRSIGFVVNNLSDSVMSLSWGIWEDLSYYGWPLMDAYLYQAAASGMSVFVSSGDSGSVDPNTGFASAVYPASNPFVTAVGGTTLHVDSDGTYSYETGWGGSGGGPSQIFAKPSWQRGYGVPSDGSRDIPDVSMDADPKTGVHVIVNGRDIGVSIGGTSLSAPLMAGAASLAIQNIRGRLGPMNPYIYGLANSSYGENFHDVSSGSNGDFSASLGYDMVTGWGTVIAGPFVDGVSRMYYSEMTNISFSGFSQTPENATYGQCNYTFSASVTDNQGEIESVSFIMDDIVNNATGNGTDYFFSLFDLSAGSHFFYWNATDNHGFNSNSGLMEYNVSRANVSVNLTVNGRKGNVAIFHGEAVDIVASLEGSSESSDFGLYFNDILINSNSSVINFSSVPDSGGHTIGAVFGGSQNFTPASEASWLFVEPLVRLSHPANSSRIYGSNISVNFTLQGMFLSYNTTLMLNGNQSWLQLENATGNSVFFPGLQNGTYNLTLAASNGSIEDSLQIAFTMVPEDTLAPVVSNAVIDNQFSRPGQDVTVGAQIYDDSEVDQSNLTVSDASWNILLSKAMSALGSNWSATFNLGAVPDGIYYINISSSDIFGNRMDAWIFNLTVEGYAPPPAQATSQPAASSGGSIYALPPRIPKASSEKPAEPDVHPMENAAENASQIAVEDDSKREENATNATIDEENSGDVSGQNIISGFASLLGSHKVALAMAAAVVSMAIFAAYLLKSANKKIYKQADSIKD